MSEQGWTQPDGTWHADDCGGTCDGCGHIAEDGFWYAGPCPANLKAWQVQHAEG